jgi:hypothetical protein
MNYRVVYDGMFSTILGTLSAPDDNEDIYSSLAKAKEVLAEDLSTRINDLLNCKRRMRRLKAAQIEHELLG